MEMEWRVRGLLIHTINTLYMNYKYIIIGGDNINTLGIVRSLGEAGISPIIILYKEGHIKLVPYSKYAKHVTWVESTEEGLTLMLKNVSENCRPFVYTTDDNTESYFDLHYDELIQHFYFYNASEAGRITHLMNKKFICDLAEECGFYIPKGEVVSRGELPKGIKYPVITKTLTPYSSGWKRDVGIFYSDDELAEAYKGMKSEKFLLQEYVQKNGEMQIRGISYNNGQKVIIPYYSTVMRCTDTSFGGYYQYHHLNDVNLKEKVCLLLKKIRYNGIFTIDFLIDKNNTPVFLEVNFRSGAYDYADTFGNINHPYLWSQLVIDAPINITNLRSDYSAIDGISEFCSFVLSHRISLGQWLKELREADCYFFFNKKDPLPLFAYLVSRFVRKFRKLIEKK